MATLLDTTIELPPGRVPRSTAVQLPLPWVENEDPASEPGLPITPAKAQPFR